MMKAWRMAGVVAAVALTAMASRAAEFQVATAQELQNALTAAAVNGESDTIFLAAGYYVGNFNFNSDEAHSLTLQAAPGVDRTEVTIDGDGAGRSMSLTVSGVGDLTVRGITVLRNCGAEDRAGMRLSAGRDILVDDCRFMAGATHQGIGVEIVAARDATVEDSMFQGDPGTWAQGRGLMCSGVTGDVVVRENTFSGNNGGAYVSGGTSVTFSGNTFSGNSSSSVGGGGAYVYGGSGTTVTLIGNTLRGNSSGSGGGGAYVYGGSGTTVTLSGNTFSGNSSSSVGGGGAYVSGGSGTTVTLNGNTFSGNSSTSVGGGACVAYGTTVTFSGNTFSGNSSSSSAGGGAYVSGGSDTTVALTGNLFSGNSGRSVGGLHLSGGTTATLSRNIFRDNRATAGSGGGLYASLPTLQLFNNLFHGNSQQGTGAGGGAWIKATTRLEMVNNTLTENQAAGNGGGAFFQVDGTTEELHVFNNIIWGNTAAGNGADVAMAGTGSWKEFSYNCAHGMYGVWDRAEHNLDLAPVFFDPVNRNYRLRNTSPCLDAGFNDATNLPETDLDGEPRIANVTVDMGAYEFSNTDPHPADLNNNWVIEESEYNAYAAAWKNDQEWSRGPNPIPADYVTRAGYLLESGGNYENDGSGGKPVCWIPE